MAVSLRTPLLLHLRARLKKINLSRHRYRYTPAQSSLAMSYDNAPGVSILRPLKGLDTNLYENLESSFKQEYPNFEIIFSVADEDDEALTVVYALRNRYPHVRTNVIVGTVGSRYTS